ncbi:hypothetical protein TorRG33x02_134870 [Trema orientale]|uniref:Uncharacterized protein n=1 Tax=Trema orientale TaxID=63057 RepID=A0A2P5EYM0_TREOI|nr:hypothetical protein TorRG33x02_134870 [Trema orientale]
MEKTEEPRRGFWFCDGEVESSIIDGENFSRNIPTFCKANQLVGLGLVGEKGRLKLEREEMEKRGFAQLNMPWPTHSRNL